MRDDDADDDILSVVVYEGDADRRVAVAVEARNEKAERGVDVALAVTNNANRLSLIGKIRQSKESSIDRYDCCKSKLLGVLK